MELDELISDVEAQAVTDEPLDQLSAAMAVKADVDDLTDSLIGVFVDRARTAGCSWSEIGFAMGVSKQAAQQRHRSERPKRERAPWRMGRWTDRAKTVVHEANSAAVDLGHDYVGTEHLLLGLLAVPQGIGGRVLIGAGITPEKVLARAPAAVPDQPRRGHRRHAALTPRAKQVLAQTLQNAVQLGHNYVGTEHQLLALFDVPEGIAAQVLDEGGLTKAQAQAKVVQLLANIA